MRRGVGRSDTAVDATWRSPPVHRDPAPARAGRGDDRPRRGRGSGRRRPTRRRTGCRPAPGRAAGGPAGGRRRQPSRPRGAPAPMRYASGCASATWPPRRAASRGVATVNPSGASRWSVRSISSAVSATDLARRASMPACGEHPHAFADGDAARAPAASPTRSGRRRGRGRMPGPMANWSRWANHPQIGERRRSVLAPDVQKAGRSGAGVEVLVRAARRRGRLSLPSSAIGTAPAAWLRSHSVSAPWACATSFAAAMSTSAPDLNETRDRHTSAVGVVDRGPEGGEVRAVDGIGGDHAQLGAAMARQALEDVAVGWEVVLVGDDRRAVRVGVQRRGRQLVEVDGGGVGHQHLPGRGAEERPAELVANLDGEVDPLVPTGRRGRRPTRTARPGRARRPSTGAAGRASCRRGR